MLKRKFLTFLIFSLAFSNMTCYFMSSDQKTYNGPNTKTSENLKCLQTKEKNLLLSDCYKQMKNSYNLKKNKTNSTIINTAKESSIQLIVKKEKNYDWEACFYNEVDPSYERIATMDPLNEICNLLNAHTLKVLDQLENGKETLKFMKILTTGKLDNTNQLVSEISTKKINRQEENNAKNAKRVLKEQYNLIFNHLLEKEKETTKEMETTFSDKILLLQQNHKILKKIFQHQLNRFVHFSKDIQNPVSEKKDVSYSNEDWKKATRLIGFLGIYLADVTDIVIKEDKVEKKINVILPEEIPKKKLTRRQKFAIGFCVVVAAGTMLCLGIHWAKKKTASKTTEEIQENILNIED